MTRKTAEEQLILVDESNRATGSAGKTAIHRDGLLHRAFSIFIVDDRGRIVLQRRNPRKYHSGGLWANSCCGHPRPGERTISAARRRLNEELGVTSALRSAFSRATAASSTTACRRNEFVYVYFGRLESEPRPDPAEIAEVALLSCEDIARRIKSDPNSFAFWFKHYFRNHGADIARLAKKAARSDARNRLALTATGRARR